MIKKTTTQTLVLLDVHAILHRAYHALPDFTTKSGVPTGGLYGLTATMIKLIDELKPDYLVACYDLPEPTFRKVAYEQYKAGRRPTETNLVTQIERSRELFSALNIPVYEKVGFEADDIIGTIAEITKKQKTVKIIIASGDLDTLQLVDDDQVLVYTFKKSLNETMLYDETAVLARFNFGPELLPDWKGLRGDPSDNIIGIAGIGEKTATTLVTNFGPLEKMYTKLKKAPGTFRALGLTERVIKLLLEGEEEAIFSKTLATIRRDAPIDFALPSAPWRADVKKETAGALFDQWEFKTLKNRFNNLFEGESLPLARTHLDIDRKLKIAAWLLNKGESLPVARTHLDIDNSDSLLMDLKREGLERVYNEIELPLIPILDAAHARGVRIDLSYLSTLAHEVRQELEALGKKIYAIVGREFNLNSPKQLGQILFGELHLPIKGLKKTAGGVRSTRESELAKLRNDFPIIADILAYRERQKLLSTYLDALPQLTDVEGVIHTTFDQTGAATGRFSSRDPNLQNIPAFAGLGEKVRRAFVARSGYRFVALDYSQIEMRVLAVLSGDTSLQDLFKKNMDVHTGVAARVFGLEAGNVTKEMRQQAKVINFGIIYGMGINALRASLNTTRQEAMEFYRRYFETFPQIRAYFDQVKTEARKIGYTITQFGRRRYLPALNSPLPFVRAEAERMAMNAPIQGTAADIIKLAMIKAEKDLTTNNLRAAVHLLLTVHDELIFEVAEDKVTATIPVLQHAMETVVDWPIPLTVKVATGVNWGELTELT